MNDDEQGQAGNHRGNATDVEAGCEHGHEFCHSEFSKKRKSAPLLRVA
jgi:hypothetical protein